jgi:hypothetical protein
MKTMFGRLGMVGDRVGHRDDALAPRGAVHRVAASAAAADDNAPLARTTLASRAPEPPAVPGRSIDRAVARSP